MRRYRDFWVTAAGAMAAVGGWAAVATWPLSGLLIAFATTVVLAAAMVFAATADDDSPWPYRRVAAWALGAGVGLMAFAGLTMLLGGATLPCLAVLAASSPPVVRRMGALCRALHPQRGQASLPHSAETPPSTGTDSATPTAHPTPYRSEEQPGEPTPLDAEARAMDDARLCWAWRTSYLTLQRATTPQHRLRVVQQRQEYLDELERRNPAGVAAWLTAGARAAGDPSRYVISTRRHH